MKSTSRYLKIPVAQLSPDPSVQRQFRQYRADKIAREFNWHSLDALTVVPSETPDHFWVVNGQHRLAAVRALYPTSSIDCMVRPPLTEAERALVSIQSNNSMSMMAYDLYKNSVTAGDPVAVAIEEALADAGLASGRCASASTVAAVQCLQEIYNRCGRAVLEDALRIAEDGFGRSSLTWKREILEGIARFIKINGRASGNKLPALIDGLQPSTVLNKSLAYAVPRTSEKRGQARLGPAVSSPGTRVALVLRDLYNAKNKGASGADSDQGAYGRAFDKRRAA